MDRIGSGQKKCTRGQLWNRVNINHDSTVFCSARSEYILRIEAHFAFETIRNDNNLSCSHFNSHSVRFRRATSQWGHEFDLMPALHRAYGVYGHTRMVIAYGHPEGHK